MSSGSIQTSLDLPWFEDIVKLYYYKTFENTFPSTDFTTMFIAVIHILGAYLLYFGLLLPPQYIWIHTIYLSLVLSSYIIFDQNCFMTLLANMNTDNDKPPLYIRMSSAIKTLIVVFTYSLASNFYPQIAPYSILKRYFNSY